MLYNNTNALYSLLIVRNLECSKNINFTIIKYKRNVVNKILLLFHPNKFNNIEKEIFYLKTLYIIE